MLVLYILVNLKDFTMQDIMKDDNEKITASFFSMKYCQNPKNLNRGISNILIT